MPNATYAGLHPHSAPHGMKQCMYIYTHICISLVASATLGNGIIVQLEYITFGLTPLQLC